MGKRTRKVRAVEGGETTLGELIHMRIRGAIEQAVAEELEAALGRRYERIDATPRKKKRALCGRRPVTPNVTNSPGEGLRPNGGDFKRAGGRRDRSAASAAGRGRLPAAREHGAPSAAVRPDDSERGCRRGAGRRSVGCRLREEVALGLHLRESIVFHALRGRHRRAAHGKVEAREDRTRGLGRVDRGEDSHPPAALRADENVDGEDALKELRPGKAARTPCGGIEVVVVADADDRGARRCDMRTRALGCGISEVGGSAHFAHREHSDRPS